MFSSFPGKRYCAALAILVAAVSPVLHGEDYYFENRDISPLAAPSINCLTEDDRGCLWIGTPGGLVVYDGRKIHTYDRGSLSLLPADDIISLEYVATTREIWIGTVAGVVRYDLRNQKIKAVGVRNEGGRERSSEFLRIESTPDGRVFALSRDGIYVSERPELLEEVALEGDRTSVEFQDLDIGGDGGLWVVAGDGLLTWDEENSSFRNVMNVADPSSVAAIGNSVWVGTRNSGVFRFDPSTGGIEGYDVAEETTSLIAGTDGTVWAGSLSGGITVIDQVAHSTMEVGIDPVHPYRLPSRRITALMRGSDGHLWIGTGDAGLLSVDTRKKNHLTHVRRSGPTGLQAGPVSVILEDSLGYLWAGSDIGGLSRFDPEFQETRNYVHDPDDLFSLPGDNITAMIEDSTGRLWVGTDGGPAIYLPEVDGFEPPGGMMGGWPDFQYKHVLSMVEDAGGSIWISFRSGELYRLDPFDWDYRRYGFIPASTAPSILVSDRYGSVWAGSRQGLRLYNDAGTLVKTWLSEGIDRGGIPEGGATALSVDSSDRLWIGGPGGLAVYEGVERGFRFIEQPLGVSMSVTGIVEDGARHHWVVDGRRIHLFSGDGTYITTMGGDSGLTPSGLISGIAVGRAGTIHLGANGEIWSFDGFVETPESVRPRVYFTQLKVFDEEVANGRELEEKGFVSLSSGENMFSIGFGAVDHRFGSRIGFQYKLAGFHDEWIDGGDNDSVMYAKLPPGRYEFILRAYDELGKYSDEAVLAVKVDPAFWSTPLAIGIYVIALSAFIAIIVKLREGQLLKTQVKELEEARMKVLEANRKLEFLTMNDSLTGLLNRRGFDQAIGHALTTANRNDLMITLFMMDVDFFKAYNDNYGHVRGDEVLRGVGKALRNVFERSTDIIARYGGEEFAVVFIGENPNASVTLANDLILAVESLGIRHEYSSISELLTLSIGSATVRAVDTVTVGKLVDTADRALYAAKAGGRNRTCFTGILPELPEQMKNGIEPMTLEPETAR